MKQRILLIFFAIVFSPPFCVGQQSATPEVAVILFSVSYDPPTETPTPTPTPTQNEFTWIDFSYSGLESGSFDEPYNTVDEGVLHANPGTEIHIKTGATTETLRITKRVKIVAEDGSVRIGGVAKKVAAISALESPIDDSLVIFDAKALLNSIKSRHSTKNQSIDLFRFARFWQRRLNLRKSER